MKKLSYPKGRVKHHTFSGAAPDLKRLGDPIQLGNVGDVESYGLAQKYTIVIGLNKGKEERNQTGKCLTVPATLNPEVVDNSLLSMREGQVGRNEVGMTRQLAKGWYKGDPEKSLVYDVAYIKTDAEPTFEKFEANMKIAAEKLAERYCQDSVMLFKDTGKERETEMAIWEKK